MSGSDDQRLCFWRPSEEVAAAYGEEASDDPEGLAKGIGGRPTSQTPHPFSLHSSIVTGHQANIFSAKYLPNASSVQVVSCAGDAQVRVFDVERLSTLTSAPDPPRHAIGRRARGATGWRAQMEAMEASYDVSSPSHVARAQYDGRHGEG